MIKYIIAIVFASTPALAEEVWSNDKGTTTCYACNENSDKPKGCPEVTTSEGGTTTNFTCLKK